MTWFFAGMILMRVLTTLFFFLVIARIAVAVVGRGREDRRSAGKYHAILTLRRILAEGDITIAEYRERLSVLREE